MKHAMTRRQFARRTTAATAFMVVPSYVVGRGQEPPPSERLNVAGIGVGGKGGSDIAGLASGGNNVVAVCDVNDKTTANAQTKYPQAESFRDFRKMIDKLGDKIDAVNVSTPDHNHFHAALYAIAHGINVYVQKPLTHSIWEAEMLGRAAKKYNVKSMMGNQGHSGEGTRMLKEWVTAGVIGDVTEAHVWTNRPIWPQGMNRPTDKQDIPASMDWDQWIGPSPMRPYHPAYAPFKWRGWLDFGTGALGDMACHILDASFWALDLKDPLSVEAETTPVNKESYPSASKIVYEFGPRGKMPACKMFWYDGGNKPPRPEELEEDRKLSNGGFILKGTKGAIYCTDDYCSGPRLIPEPTMQAFAPRMKELKTLPRSPGHYQEFIRACKGGPNAEGDFSHAVPLTKTVLLGNLAVLTGEKVHWDAKNMKASNNVAGVDEIVRREYRKGWNVSNI